MDKKCSGCDKNLTSAQSVDGYSTCCNEFVTWADDDVNAWNS